MITKKFKTPDDLAQRLEREARKLGESEATIIRRALRAYFDAQEADPS